jgi:hypothetical protein
MIKALLKDNVIYPDDRLKKFRVMSDEKTKCYRQRCHPDDVIRLAIQITMALERSSQIL